MFQAGKNLHFYVTVSDGQHTAKSEVNVNIQDPRTPINPSKPLSTPYGFGKNPGVINFPGLFQRIPSNGQKIPNYQVLPPSDSPMTKNVYPPVYQQPVNFNLPHQRIRNNQTTPLKLVPIKEVRNEISEKPPSTETTTSTAKSSSKTVKEEPDSGNELPLDKPIKSSSEFTSAIIPILSVVVVFCTVGAVAVLFRKKIILTKTNESKKDMVGTNFQK